MMHSSTLCTRSSSCQPADDGIEGTELTWEETAPCVMDRIGPQFANSYRLLSASSLHSKFCCCVRLCPSPCAQVDAAGFESAMEEARQKSRAGGRKAGVSGGCCRVCVDIAG